VVTKAMGWETKACPVGFRVPFPRPTPTNGEGDFIWVRAKKRARPARRW